MAVATLRRPVGSVLVVLRAITVFLGAAATLVGGVSAMVTVGVGDSVSRHGARLLLLAAAGAAAVVGGLLDRRPLDDRGEGLLASSILRVTMRQLLAAAVVGPLGLVLAWSTGDRSLGLLGALGALSLVVLWAPTERRLDRWQGQVSDQGSDLSVRQALSLPYGPDPRPGRRP